MRVILTVFFLIKGLGDSVFAQCDFIKQKEIKLTDRFYFGESVNSDTLIAMKFARTELINQIANVYLNTRQRFESDSVLVVNNIQYCLSEYGNRFLAIAYVQKAMFDSSHSVAFNIVKVNFTEKVTAENRRNDASISSGKLDQRNVIDSLTEFIQKRDLTRSLIKYASRNLLVFSTKEALVENVADCYVFPIDKESDHVLGCLNFEKPFRRNILDGRIVKDYKLEFTNANFIWVYVY